MVRIGIIGFGFIGRIHFNAYAQHPLAHVVAIAEANPDCLGGGASGNLPGSAIDPALLSDVRVVDEAAKLLDDPTIDAVSVCVPTPLHVEIALAALDQGKHVLVEKPVALSVAEAQPIVTAAAAHSTQICMPAMCMRFWPGWRWIRDSIAARTYGRVRSAVFTRLTAAPHWSKDFYTDAGRCGGALLDLHIHDADFVRFCFGDVRAVDSVGVGSATGGIDHVITRYQFDDGPELVIAEGGWMSAPGFPFSMRYRIEFENVTAEFDSSRAAPLTLYGEDGGARTIDLPDGDGYAAEIAHFVDCIERGAPSDVVTIADGVDAIALIEAERMSIETGRRVTAPGATAFTSTK